MSNSHIETWSTALTPAEITTPLGGHLASYSIPAPGLSAAHFLRQALGRPRVFWANGRSRQLHAGFGIAAQLLAWGPGRFADIQSQASSLFADAHVYAADNALAAPRLFGGFSFSDDFAPDNTWAVFHPAHFILPHFQLSQSAGESWLTINAIITPDETLSETRDTLYEALCARFDALRESAAAETPLPNQAAAPLHLNYPLPFQTWEGQINEAINTIAATPLEKVVLARVCEISSPQRLDIDAALAFLNETYQECTRFLFEPRPYHAFYGATPELLAHVQDDRLTTMALAGSAPRGKTAAADAAQRQTLLNSAKDQREHRLVVEAMCRRLAPHATEITHAATPEVYALGYIHHLLTPITASLTAPGGVLPLVQALHPTPALGGTPRDLALAFIRDVEAVPRGWYAGPVGWLDHQLNGEFVVAIRSAVAQERRAWLYAGAGIVAGSDPTQEWAETALKFEPMLRALGVDPAITRRPGPNLEAA
jgi:menaquinone-specific isochorismate synthase